MSHLLAFAAGLLVGWNLIPQPLWVLEIIDRIARLIRR